MKRHTPDTVTITLSTREAANVRRFIDCMLSGLPATGSEYADAVSLKGML